MRRLFIVVFMVLAWSLASGQVNQTASANSSAQPVSVKQNKEADGGTKDAQEPKNSPHFSPSIVIYGGTFSGYGKTSGDEDNAGKNNFGWGEGALWVQAVCAIVTAAFFILQWCILNRQTKILAEQSALSEKLARISERQLEAIDRQAHIFDRLKTIANEWDARWKGLVPTIRPPSPPPPRFP